MDDKKYVTAQEARQIADDFNSEEFLMKKILSEVAFQSRAGNYCSTSTAVITDSVKKKLETLGYKLTPENGGRYTKISWELEVKSIQKKPTVEIHIITYNEEIMLPFTIAHYKRMFENPVIFVHDNNSTDQTVAIAAREGCKILPFATDGMNDTVHRQLKSIAAMNAATDWVICVDCDENCMVNSEDLQVLEERGIDIVEFQGWDIFDDVGSPGDIKEAKGCQSPGYCKPVLLRTASFSEIEFGAGAHKIERVVGKDGKQLNWSKREYNLIHYKHWSRKWHLNRSAELGARQSQENLQRGYSTHFALPVQEHINWFENHIKSAIPIPDKHLQNK